MTSPTEKAPAHVIDTDVHPSSPRGLKDVMPYLTTNWQRRFETLPGLPGFRMDSAVGGFALDAVPPGGGKPGSDPEFMRRHLLDAHRIDYAILIPFETNYVARMANPDETAVLTAAFNDYFIEEWLPLDRRFRLAIGANPKDPRQAAAEVRRSGHRPGVAAVFIPVLNVLLGDRHFHPIYEAAEELGLPITIHVGAGEGEYQGAPTFAGGNPNHYNQWHAMFPQIAQSNVISLVLEGTFERFPKLKFVFVEWGFSWLPHVLWRMDREWKSLRVATPWVKELPSYYVRKHIRLSTQPFDEPTTNELIAMLEMCHAGETLVFSSDYPHWDNDFPARTLAPVPEALRNRILFQNAMETFPGLTLPITASA